MKRFTETDKWRDTWFRKLKPLSKLAFLYVVDNCDAAGVWDPDAELGDFTIGAPIDWPEVFKDLGARVAKLPDGKWHLTRFVEFQCGELVEECRPHAKIMTLLKSHGIPYRKGIRRVSIPTGRRQEEDNTGKEAKEAGAAAPPAAVTAETIYAAYPKKAAKDDALKAIGRAMEKCPPAKLLAAAQAYATAVGKWPQNDRRFIPHPATWFNRGSYDDDPNTWIREPPSNGKPAPPPSSEPDNLK